MVLISNQPPAPAEAMEIWVRQDMVILLIAELEQVIQTGLVIVQKITVDLLLLVAIPIVVELPRLVTPTVVEHLDLVTPTVVEHQDRALRTGVIAQVIVPMAQTLELHLALLIIAIVRVIAPMVQTLELHQALLIIVIAQAIVLTLQTLELQVVIPTTALLATQM
jgi:hypothetical protein